MPSRVVRQTEVQFGSSLMHVKLWEYRAGVHRGLLFSKSLFVPLLYFL